MKVLRLVLFLLVAALSWPAPASGDTPIEAKVTNVENKFPEEVVFTAEATSSAAEVRSVELRMMVGSGPLERYGSIEISPGKQVKGQYSLKTGGNNYVPPGTDITYWLVVQDVASNNLQTDKSLYWYGDTRFQWSKLQEGPVTVYYYGGAESNAKQVMQAGQDTRRKVGGMLGTEAQPFKVMLYNSVPDIIGAQRPEASEVRQRELIRAGVAYSGPDLVQVLGIGSVGATDTARHEIAHLFVHWSAGVSVPTWLNEGLAVWAQSDPGAEYRQALQNGIQADRLQLLRGLDSFPGRSDETIMAYGQSWSVVKYLIDSYGPEKMRKLMETIKAGDGVVKGLQEIYGLKVDGLDAEWRKSVGARPRSYESVVPTAISLPTIAPIGAVEAPPPQATPRGAGENGSEAIALPPLVVGVAVVAVALLLLVGGAAVFTLTRRRA